MPSLQSATRHVDFASVRGVAARLRSRWASVVGWGGPWPRADSGFEQRDLAAREQERILAARARARYDAARFEHALALLACDQSEVRCGAIYALEALMRSVEHFHQSGTEVLSAFVRARARQDTGPSTQKLARPVDLEDDDTAISARLPSDVQAALSVLGRNPTAQHPERSLDLHGIALRGAYLPDCQFAGAFFYDSDLTGALLCGCDLRGVWMWRAKLHLVNFDGADLRGADLCGALGLESGQLDHARLDAGTRLPPDLMR